jgi:hypothetical protein
MNEHRFTPIIVLSTLSREDRVKEGKAAGASRVDLQAIYREASDRHD